VEGNTIRVGTRGSKLALIQTNATIAQLQTRFPAYRFEPVIVKSTGDARQNIPLRAFSTSGIFTRELEQALLDGTIDFAVHSMKDLPAVQPPELMLTDPPKRADCRDVLILRDGLSSLEDLPQGATVGTGSLRRSRQLLALRPDLQIVPIRGNIETRMRKATDGELDGVMLAAAGLQRAGYASAISAAFSPLTILPAPAQGILGLEVRKDNAAVRAILDTIRDKASAIAARAERAFLRGTGAGCHAPVGAYCVVEGDSITLTAVYGAEDDGAALVRGSVSGKAEAAEALGLQLAAQLCTAYERNSL
jgi:hydroxymethylbilane synthase